MQHFCLENSGKKMEIQQNVEQNVELLRTNQGNGFRAEFRALRPSENDKLEGKIHSIDH